MEEQGIFKSVEITDISDIKIIKVIYDQIDMFNIVEIIDDLQKVIGPGVLWLFDLSEIRFIDSSGLGGLIKMQKRLREEGGKLALCNAGKNVANLLRLTQTQVYLPCFIDIESAVKQLPDYKFDN